ncbi:MAG: lipopolysaccharide heptosyltransferase II [Patescibacteria group bacterium]
MEPQVKKINTFISNLVLFTDYYLYKLFSLFKKKDIPLDKIKKILIVELTQIGDVIATTPVLRALKKNFKNSYISVMIFPEMKDIFVNNPNVDDFILYKEQKFFDLVKEVKNKDFDLAVILRPGSVKISLLLYLSKIDYRIGCRRPVILEGKGYFLTKKVKPSSGRKHIIDENLEVLKLINIKTDDKSLELYTDKDSEKYITNLLTKSKLNNKKIIAIHPGCNLENHRWLNQKFSVLADTLIKKYNVSIILTGSEKDKLLADDIQNNMNNGCLNLAGKTNLKQFIALIKRMDMLISVDTSAIHIASAFNTPVIALFGAGDPKIWGPYSKKSSVIFKDKEVCTSCMKEKCIYKSKRFMECMKKIGVEDILLEVKRLMR